MFDQTTEHHSLAKLAPIVSHHNLSLLLILYITLFWIMIQVCSCCDSFSLSVSLPPHINSENKIKLAPKIAKWNYNWEVFFLGCYQKNMKLVWLLRQWNRAVHWMKNAVTATKIPQWSRKPTVPLLCCLVSSGALAFNIYGLHIKPVLEWAMISL